MNKQLNIIIVFLILISGCNNKQIGDYIAASSITKDGFAKNRNQMLKEQGKEIKIWGFVDHPNIFVDSTTWKFNIKAKQNDEVGKSFSVIVPNDQGRDALMKVFLADEKADRATRVFVKGKVFVFDAPSMWGSNTGISIKVKSTIDIKIK